MKKLICLLFVSAVIGGCSIAPLPAIAQKNKGECTVTVKPSAMYWCGEKNCQIFTEAKLAKVFKKNRQNYYVVNNPHIHAPLRDDDIAKFTPNKDSCIKSYMN